MMHSSESESFPEIQWDRRDARVSQDIKDRKLCQMIAETMGRDGPQRIVLAGKSGIGKTRLAKMFSQYATNMDMCYLTLCLHLNGKFEDEMSLYEDIAFQIEVYDRDDKKNQDKKDLLQDLKEKIILELEENKISTDEKNMNKMLTKKHPKKSADRKEEYNPSYLLLLLDDEGNKTSEDKVMRDLGLESFLKGYAPLKVLITRRQGDENITQRDGETESHAADESHGAESDGEIESDDMDDPQDIRSDEQIESHTARAETKWEGRAEFHTTDVSQELLNSLDEDNNILKILVFLVNHEAWKIVEPFMSGLVRTISCLPAAIVVVAKSLNCITRQSTFKSLSPKQKKVIEEFLLPCKPAYSVPGYNPILQLAYQLLETDGTLNSAIVDCFWHSLELFKHCGYIHYNELITHWIFEGYFDPVRSVKEAYKDGHAILVELINRGFLKIQEGDMVVPEMAMSDLIDLRHHGFLGRSRLRYARVYGGGDKNKGLGKITQIDDMIKTVQTNKRDNVRTILVSGNRLRRETPKKFFEQSQMKDLEVLGLFDPTLEYIIQSLKELKQLRVLVIRDYDLLTSIEEIKGLRKLEVLEVSGASSLETISDDFFDALLELHILNLSGLRIKSSPSSISRLKYLHSLILRDCPVLEDLPDIQHLDRLEVLDVRGAHKLKTCFGMEGETSRNRTFSRLQQLQLLDFSESKLKRLPIFQDPAAAANLHSLTRLSLRKCRNLAKLPSLRPLSGLQILDLSGTNLAEIAEVCFEQKEELKILNLSGTMLTKLPSTISGLFHLSQLILSDNSNLEVLPDIKGLTNLEVFDVSGCTNLHKIEGSFVEISYLREINLSGTRIEILPEFPVKSSISCSKVLVLANSRRLIHDHWSQVKEEMTNEIYESPSSSNMVGSVGEIWAFDHPEKKGCRREHLYKGHVYMDVYKNTIPFVDTISCQEVIEIQGSNGVYQDKETLDEVEFVAIVEKSAANITSTFNDLKSVKGCWLEMCGDMEILFSGVDEERLGNLETLSVTNLRRLESIRSSSFKNLKKVSLDCCPNIKTLFPASALPTSLEILKIKFCEKLEKVFEEEVEVPNLHALWLFNLPVLSAINAMLPNLKTYKKDKCPKLETSKDDLRGPDLE